MSSSEESDSGRRSSDEEENEKTDEENEEVVSQSQDDSASPSRSPARSQKHSSRSKSASLNALAFPISRVRRLVKSDGDMLWVGVEAGFLVAKAAELFVEKFAEELFEKLTEDGRTTLHYEDMAEHVSSTERMDFLADIIPEMVTASTALLEKADPDG